MMAEYGQVDQEILMRELVPTDQGIEVVIMNLLKQIKGEIEKGKLINQNLKENGGMNQGKNIDLRKVLKKEEWKC